MLLLKFFDDYINDMLFDGKLFFIGIYDKRCKLELRDKDIPRYRLLNGLRILVSYILLNSICYYVS